MRSSPEGRSSRSGSVPSACRMAARWGAVRSYSAAPAVLSATCRVVRWNSSAPTAASRRATARLTVPFVTPIALAAAEKLALSATARNGPTRAKSIVAGIQQYVGRIASGAQSETANSWSRKEPFMTTNVASLDSRPTRAAGKGITVALWIAQVLLAGLFGMAGAMKSTAPFAALATKMPWTADVPHALVRFIGLAELAAALGLLLPSLTRVRPRLTPLAAAGLVTVMVLAALFHL